MKVRMRWTFLLVMLVPMVQLACDKKKPQQPAEVPVETLRGVGTEPANKPIADLDVNTEKSVEDILSESDGDVMDKPTSTPKSAPDKNAKAKQASHPVSSGSQFYKEGVQAWRNMHHKVAQLAFLQSCQLGYIQGCHRYGWIQQGLGHLTTALQFYRQGCRSGLAKSCNNIGFIAERMGNYQEARNYYIRACLRKHTKGCENSNRISGLIASGTSGVKENLKAKKLFAH